MDGGNEERNNSAHNNSTHAWHLTFDYDRYGNRGINVANTSDNADAANSAFRYYSNIQGRFVSVDPIIVTPERFLDPQQSGKRDIDKPKKGVDGQIGINFDFRHKNSESTTNLPQALDFTLTFHELAEAYAKVDGNMQYAQAHKKAEDRETKLREQRPYLKGYNPGSGPGTKIIIKK